GPLPTRERLVQRSLLLAVSDMLGIVRNRPVDRVTHEVDDPSLGQVLVDLLEDAGPARVLAVDGRRLAALWRHAGEESLVFGQASGGVLPGEDLRLLDAAHLDL